MIDHTRYTRDEDGEYRLRTEFYIAVSDEAKPIWCTVCHDNQVQEVGQVCNACVYLPLSEWEGWTFTAEQYKALMAARAEVLTLTPLDIALLLTEAR